MLETLRLRLYAFDRVRCGSWWQYRHVNSPFTRLFYVLDGEAYVEHSGQRYGLTPGKLVLIPPFTRVDYCCPDWFENYYAIFTSRIGEGIDLLSCVNAEWLVDAGPGVAAQFERLQRLNPDYRLKIYDPAHPDYNRQIWQTTHIDQSLPTVLETSGLLRLLLANFFQHSAPLFKPGFQDARLVRVFHYIEANLHRPLTLIELADTAALSPTYFSDYFCRVTGTRPIPYVNQKRIERAQRLLLTTPVNLKQIAADCGFDDPDYFCRVFKRATGIRPTAYRTSQAGAG